MSSYVVMVDGIFQGIHVDATSVVTHLAKQAEKRARAWKIGVGDAGEPVIGEEVVLGTVRQVSTIHEVALVGSETSEVYGSGQVRTNS